MVHENDDFDVDDDDDDDVGDENHAVTILHHRHQ